MRSTLQDPERAIETLDICFVSRRSRLSIQVLQAFSVARSINAILDGEPPRGNEKDILLGCDDRRRGRESGAPWLLTEDLQDGQRYTATHDAAAVVDALDPHLLKTQ